MSMQLFKKWGIVGMFVVLAIGVVIGGWLRIKHYLGAQANTSTSCQKRGVSHTVLIQNGPASPAHTTAKHCDSLTITNRDHQTRLMAFGPHEDHQAYDGVVEKVLHQGDS